MVSYNMTNEEYRNELNQLTLLIRGTAVEPMYQPKIDDLLTSVGSEEPTEQMKTNLEKLKDDIVKYYKDIVSRFYYAIDSNEILKVGTLLGNLEAASPTDKLTRTREFINEVNSIMNTLKSKNVVEDDLNTTYKNKNTIENIMVTHSLKKASKSSARLSRLEDDLVKATSDDERKIIIANMDKELAKLNSTNRTLTRLKKKNGRIDPHQRSLKVKAKDIKRIRNQSMADMMFDSNTINNKIEFLKNAYRKEEEAKGKSWKERHEAKKLVKEAERGLYTRKLTKLRKEKIGQQIEKRNEIINNAKIQEFSNEYKYRSQFKKTMKELKKIDKKIIGRRNTKELYAGLKNKAGYLVGGTSLTLPKQVVELTSSFTATTR